MAKYYYAKTHFDYGVIVSPETYLEKLIWVIRTEKGKEIMRNDICTLIENKEIVKILDKIKDFPKADTLEELIRKIKKEKECH